MKVGIVGCGNVAGAIDDDPKKRHIYGHATAISKIPELELVASCDIDVVTALNFAGTWHCKTYPHIKILLDKHPDLDILVIATPTNEHATNLIDASVSEVKGIFCEKPLSFQLEVAQDAVEFAYHNNKLLFVNYTRRWDPFYQECKAILDSGEIGRIETIVAYVDTALYMNSSHMLDMLAWYAGSVKECKGYLDKNYVREVHGSPDPGGIAMFLHDSDIVSFLKATGESQKNHFFEMDIMGTKGRMSIHYDDQSCYLWRFKDSDQHTGLLELSIDTKTYRDNTRPKEQRLVLAYEDIIECIKTGKKPVYSAEQSLEAIKMVEMIYDSDKEAK